MRYTILNRTGRISLFKRGLHEVILAPGDRLVLGYGYLYENVITNMDDDGTKLNDKNKDSAFIKEFRKWVNSNNNSEKEIIIIGNNEDNYRQYIKVAKYFDDTFSNLKIKVIIKDKNKYRQYHKKLAIKFTRENNNKFKPSMALIGSSNFSEPTYVDQNYSQEVDILLWDRYILEDNKKSIKNVRTKELEMLKRLNKNSSYIDKYEEILDLIDRVGIDFRLELQLEDVINEIENYNSCGFSLKYINERVYRDLDINIAKLIDIIKSSEKDTYYDKNTNKYEYIFDEELKQKVLINCILCFYRRARYILNKEQERFNFDRKYELFKRLIFEKTKDEIIDMIENDREYYENFENDIFRYHIKGEEVNQYFISMLEQTLEPALNV